MANGIKAQAAEPTATFQKMATTFNNQMQTLQNTAEVDPSWEELKKQIADMTTLIGGLVFAPIFIFLGCAYGLRAGIITALKETLRLMRSWNR